MLSAGDAVEEDTEPVAHEPLRGRIGLDPLDQAAEPLGVTQLQDFRRATTVPFDGTIGKSTSSVTAYLQITAASG